jgi:3-isopropylmalate/(R)-2-methylmalate dehydratase small subunit
VAARKRDNAGVISSPDRRAGAAWVYGDNVDTDVIIPARYLTTDDADKLAEHALEDLDSTFATGVRPGDVVVAGNNFGCGSSREHAPVALKGTGVAAVVAASFARIFFRNAINTGLPIVVCPEVSRETEPGDVISVDVAESIVVNESKGREWRGEPLPDFVMDIVHAGGLVEWVRNRVGTAAAKGESG